MRSFYNVFSFGDMSIEDMDGGINFESIEVLRNVKTKDGYTLMKGQRFDNVQFKFVEATFFFVNWNFPDSETDYNYPNDTSFTIPQSELAPFLHWADGDSDDKEPMDEPCNHAVPCPSPNDYEECSKCKQIVDMRG